MKIIHTGVPDIPEKIDKQKLALADEVITEITPFINETYKKEIKEFKLLRDDAGKTKSLISKERSSLNNLMLEYNKKKKIKTLLERIMKLISNGLLTNNQLRSDFALVLKTVESLSEDKVDFYLQESIKVLNRSLKKF